MEEVQVQGYVVDNLGQVLLGLHDDPASTSTALKGKGGETYRCGDHKAPVTFFHKTT